MISINPPSSIQSAARQYYAQYIPPFQNFDKTSPFELPRRSFCRIATQRAVPATLA
jgi:hypothetical protein